MVASGTAAVQGTARAACVPAVAPYLPSGIASPLRDWLVLELVGVVARRLRLGVAGRTAAARRPSAAHGVSRTQRLIAAVAGGVLMGVGAKLARGCTSGQALSGGALLSVGSWIFIATCFAAGYAFAPLARRLWR